MSRFSNSNFRSLNESIQNINTNNRITELEEYVDMLESVLVSIAEEMECDTEELVEMAQTAQRSKEMNKKVDAAYIKHDRALQKGFAAGHSEGSKQIRKIDSDYQKVSNQNRREKSSKKLYGKGGKEIDAKRYKGKTVGAEGNLRKPKGNTETKLRDALQAERLRSLGVRSND
jgi:hypothetical protein